MWAIKLKSKDHISEATKELIVDYACSEGDKITLHDVLETNKTIELIFESKRENADNLLSIIENDFDYQTSMSKVDRCQ